MSIWYVIRYSWRLRALAVLVALLSVGTCVADRRGYIPEAGTVAAAVIAAVGALTILLAIVWSTPPGNAQGVRAAITIRNCSIAMTGALLAGLAAFSLGMGTLVAGVILPVMALVSEFAAMAGLAVRAIWYGRHPEARERLLAVCAAQAEALRAARAASREPVSAEPRVLLVPVDPGEDHGEPEAPPSQLTSAPDEGGPALDAGDEMSLVDLTGGDDGDDWPDDEDDQVAEIFDKQGNRI